MIILIISWYVVVSKGASYSENLKSSSLVFSHLIIQDNDKVLKCSNLKDTEILIFKKEAIFESVLKNIIRYLSIINK